MSKEDELLYSLTDSRVRILKDDNREPITFPSERLAEEHASILNLTKPGEWIVQPARKQRDA